MKDDKEKYTKEFIKEAEDMDEFNLPDWWEDESDAKLGDE